MRVAPSPQAVRFCAVMTQPETRFDEATEAFFDAGCEEAPDSQRPVTLDLELDELESEEIAPTSARVVYLDARRERLKRAVAEIVATLAGVAGLAFGMNSARGTAAPSQHAAATSAVVQSAVRTVPAVPVEPPSVEAATPRPVAESPTRALPAAAAAATSGERKVNATSGTPALPNPPAASRASTRLLSALRQRFSARPSRTAPLELASVARDKKDTGRRISP